MSKTLEDLFPPPWDMCRFPEKTEGWLDFQREARKSPQYYHVLPMQWIDREVEFPDLDRILCYAEGKVFICELIESKWGNFYHSTDWGHCEFQDTPEWTHWAKVIPPTIKKEIT